MNNRDVRPNSITTPLESMITRRISGSSNVRPFHVRRTRSRIPPHLDQGVTAPERFAATQLGDIDIAVTDLVETGVQTPPTIGVVVHQSATALMDAFRCVGCALRVGQRLPDQRTAFELDVRHVHRIRHQRHTPTVNNSGSIRRFEMVFHPVLRREEPNVLTRFGGVDMVRHRNPGSSRLTPQRLDTFRPRQRGRRIEPRRITHPRPDATGASATNGTSTTVMPPS